MSTSDERHQNAFHFHHTTRPRLPAPLCKQPTKTTINNRLTSDEWKCTDMTKRVEEPRLMFSTPHSLIMTRVRGERDRVPGLCCTGVHKYEQRLQMLRLGPRNPWV